MRHPLLPVTSPVTTPCAALTPAGGSWQTEGVAERQPVLRAILLGASNLRASLPVVVDEIRGSAPGPVDVLAACGNGRSYGAWSHFLFVRRLPGIVQCGLWRALAERPPIPTLALVADVGNDLVYGVEAATIAGWIETCLEKLARHQADIVLTLLPIARLERLSAWQVRLAVSVLFPGRPAPWPKLLEEARELDEHLRRIGRAHGARLVEPAADWYGLDPIHLRRKVRREAWSHTLAIRPRSSTVSARRRPRPVRIPLFAAEELRLFGMTRSNPQPAIRLADGTVLALY